MLTLFALMATQAFAIGEARMTGKILDAVTKEPIADATIRCEATESKKVDQSFKGKKDGTFAVFLLDGTIHYKFTVSAPGYESYVETIKLKLGEPNNRDFFLAKPGAGQPGTKVEMVDQKADPSVQAYNEGAALANQGDTAGAIAKFEEALVAKPDLLAATMALAKVSLKAKDYPKAIASAKKALETDDEDTDMWAVLYNAYSATGDKANAAIAQKKLPASAGSLFNDAARLINQGKDDEAGELLKQAVTMDEKMSVAWYELGMVYVRTQKNAQAKEALTKYLELDPNGKDAATAKEMLNYLK
jgi:tetratricopeptide (TPR) repeat protein